MKCCFLSARGSITAAVVVLTSWVFPVNADANTVLYQFNNVFSYSGSGSTPSDPGPWIDATFQDTSGGVLLTLKNSGLAKGEFVSGFYFNLNPADDATDLGFTFVSGTRGVNAPLIQTAEDGFKAGGGGKYDVLFSFSTAISGRFGAGDTLTWLITGITGLSAADFEFKSTPAGGHGPFFAATHVQDISCQSGSGSVWMNPALGPQSLPVPEPSAPVLVAAILMMGAATLWLRNVKLKPLRAPARCRGAAGQKAVNSRSR